MEKTESGKLKKMTVQEIHRKKKAGERIVMLTAYDYPFAKILDGMGVDIILVGDSLGNVALGYRNTIPVTMEEMAVHTRAVAGAVKRALIIADMPFGSFQVDSRKSVENAVKLVKAGAEGVKIEGAKQIKSVQAIISAGIPVMGHLGFTPQSVNLLGYKVQGKDKKSAQRIINDSKELEKAGCFAVVLEMVPEGLACRIARHLNIPVIGIGAGKKVDGQVMVTSDLLGLTDWSPSFVKPKANLRREAEKAIAAFVNEL
jgi:3-methyl-2-oxobutanoate hydroxymethyltransferase